MCCRVRTMYGCTNTNTASTRNNACNIVNIRGHRFQKKRGGRGRSQVTATNGREQTHGPTSRGAGRRVAARRAQALGPATRNLTLGTRDRSRCSTRGTQGDWSCVRPKGPRLQPCACRLKPPRGTRTSSHTSPLRGISFESGLSSTRRMYVERTAVSHIASIVSAVFSSSPSLPTFSWKWSSHTWSSPAQPHEPSRRSRRSQYLYTRGRCEAERARRVEKGLRRQSSRELREDWRLVLLELAR